MNYVEWLRVRNLLRVVAIILTILVVLAVVLRVSVSRYMSPEAWVAHLALDPGTKVTRTTLPDGTKRIVFDDPDDSTHVVVDDHGYAGKHIVVTEPTSRAQKEHSDVSVGSVRVFESRNGATTTTVIDTNGAVPMIYYMALADIVALIVATILAAPLAREVDGHLEIALTKPCSRVRYALGVILADAAGIIAASVITVIAFYFCQLLFESARLDFSGINANAIAMGLILPLAWYALLCAATTLLSRSYGAVLGFAWPVAILTGALTLIHADNVVALFVHDVAWVISRFDPLSYVEFASPNATGTYNYTEANFGLRLSIEVLFFVVYGAIAIWRWQRVEA
ncbi:MAG TPA: hypothetical protein VMU38_10490 [Candidatus Binatia bacterium]|nr:hypothetical protein [Candidatus Binatia bacterium]